MSGRPKPLCPIKTTIGLEGSIAVHTEQEAHTVDSHIRRIYEKLHVRSSTEAVSKALNDRIV